MLTRRAACCLEGRRPPRVVVHFSKDTAQIADYMAQISVAEKETREEMSAVFSYRCFEGCGKIHQLPGRIGEQPPKRVTCPNCGKECLRTYKTPGVSYRGTGWTGAQGNMRTWRKG